MADYEEDEPLTVVPAEVAAPASAAPPELPTASAVNKRLGGFTFGKKGKASAAAPASEYDMEADDVSVSDAGDAGDGTGRKQSGMGKRLGALAFGKRGKAPIPAGMPPQDNKD